MNICEMTALEISNAVKKACGKEFPVSLRYSVVSKTKGFRQGALPGEEYTEMCIRDSKQGAWAGIIAGFVIAIIPAGCKILNLCGVNSSLVLKLLAHEMCIRDRMMDYSACFFI